MTLLEEKSGHPALGNSIYYLNPARLHAVSKEDTRAVSILMLEDDLYRVARRTVFKGSRNIKNDAKSYCLIFSSKIFERFFKSINLLLCTRVVPFNANMHHFTKGVEISTKWMNAPKLSEHLLGERE